MILNWGQLGAGAILGALIVTAPVYMFGVSKGKQIMSIEALKTSVEILHERKEIDGEITTRDAADMCGTLGLSVSDQVECVRRLRETSAESGNGSLSVTK